MNPHRILKITFSRWISLQLFLIFSCVFRKEVGVTCFCFYSSFKIDTLWVLLFIWELHLLCFSPSLSFFLPLSLSTTHTHTLSHLCFFFVAKWSPALYCMCLPMLACIWIETSPSGGHKQDMYMCTTSIGLLAGPFKWHLVDTHVGRRAAHCPWSVFWVFLCGPLLFSTVRLFYYFSRMLWQFVCLWGGLLCLSAVLFL